MRLENADVYVISKADLIISKIYWARDSRSEVQQRDIRNVMATGYDEAYLEHWLKELDLYQFAGVAGMNDTTPDIERMHRELLMARSNEERFRMGISMCQTAHAIVWSSLPDDLAPAERRVRFFLRYYGHDLDSALRDWIVTRIRRDATYE